MSASLLTQPSISLLPPELQNQIAAGEVVERPSSVVKELVENSLDAGATQIEVRLEQGGIGRLSVRDNGHGIAPKELELALTRHATSKIKTFADLLRIGSLGFRGEALPSIASVARLRLTSVFNPPKTSEGAHTTPDIAPSTTPGPTPAVARANQDAAAFIEVEHGRVIDRGLAALHEGTLVEVAELFGNVPARLKFLKTPATELRRCQDLLCRLALANLHCGFSLFSGGKELFNFPAGQKLEQRLAFLWPPKVVEQLRSFDLNLPGLRCYGLAGDPAMAEPKAERMLFYVNGRAVQDKLLLSAAKQAYKGRLLGREYPQLVLFLHLPPEEVDVNVHPAKSEVRFVSEREIFSLVLRAVGQAASSFDVLAEFDSSLSAPFEPAGTAGLTEGTTAASLTKSGTTAAKPAGRSPGFWGDLDREVLIPARPKPEAEDEPVFVWDATAQPNTNMAAAARIDFTPGVPGRAAGAPIAGPLRVEEPAYSSTAGLFEREGALRLTTASQTKEAECLEPKNFAREQLEPEQLESDPFETGGVSLAAPQFKGGTQDFTYLGQIGECYLLVRQKDCLLLLDQHAVHEAILFSRLRSGAEQGQSQCLALPLHIPLHHSQLELWRELEPKLARLGYAFALQEPDGSRQDKTLVISAIPASLDIGLARALLEQILAGQSEKLHELWAMLACKAAIKANCPLTPDEALELVQQWLLTKDARYCPHGRPTGIRLGVAELEKMFKRKV